MRLAISNIAWDPLEDEMIARLLQRYNIDAIDVAPGKYFPATYKPADRDIARVRNWWAEHGIEVTGMQALLFGTTDLNMFGSSRTQVAMLEHLAEVCRIGAGLGATRLVFGSPKNRDRSGLSDQEVMDVSVAFFRRLGGIAESCGVLICLEPNPACYGANFMTSSSETAHVVEQIAHPAIKMQLDTGALTVNSEDADFLLEAYGHMIGHIHASEPNLLPLGDGGTDHAMMAEALSKHLPNHLVTIEMLASRDEPHEVSIERSLNYAMRHYLSNGVVGADL